MSLKTTLERPIFNAIIHHAYMLHDDEREVLLRAFLETSYKMHREAVEIMSPGEDIESLIAAYMQFEESPAIASSSMAAATPGNEAAAQASRKATSDQGSPIAKHLRSFRQMFRRKESILQEEEELALFSTIESVADQVNREAMEIEIMGELRGGARFAAAYEQSGYEPGETTIASKGEGEVAGGRMRTGRPGWPFDTHIECMDEDLLIMRGIIERNRAVSENCHKARAM